MSRFLFLVTNLLCLNTTPIFRPSSYFWGSMLSSYEDAGPPWKGPRPFDSSASSGQ